MVTKAFNRWLAQDNCVQLTEVAIGYVTRYS